MIKDFVALILTHGRANNVKTYKTLRDCGYTGDIIIVIDNEDKQAKEYYDIYGKEVEIFSKADIANEFDEADNFGDRRTIVYARNASFDIAKKRGYRYFIQLDDDYTSFEYRHDDKYRYSGKTIKNLDYMFTLLLEYYKSIPAITVAMAQGGDFIGGKHNVMARLKKPYRKAMNSFICDVDNRFWFKGRVNEDVNTYTNLGSQGKLLFTIPNLALCQVTTQKNNGGMADMYLDSGTYVKSFYTVIFMPSTVDIFMMGETHKRLHHRVRWNTCVPKIIDEKLKKH